MFVVEVKAGRLGGWGRLTEGQTEYRVGLDDLRSPQGWPITGI